MTILNLIMIFISFALLLLCMLTPLRKSAAVQKRPSLKMLFKPHGIYGLLLLIVSFLHGILSGNKPAMMTGKAAWLCLLILLVLSLFRKRMGTAVWLKLHRIFSVLLCVLIAAHVLHAVLL